MITDSQIVNHITRDEYAHYGQQRPPSVAAASYGADVVKMLGADFTDEQIALHARCAFRFATLALDGGRS